MYTRKQYINKEVTHQEYYGQFVTEGVVRLVKRSIGKNKIRKSKDAHFNDIPLRQWDLLNGPITSIVGNLISTANPGEGVSLSDTVCVAKAAARKILADG